MPPPNRPDDIIDLIGPGGDVIVPLANGEPTCVLDAIEAAAAAGRLSGVHVHQMHAIHDRPYLAGVYGDDLRHVAYFLSHVTRKHFANATVDLVPAHFSEVYSLMAGRSSDPIVVAAASPPDRHGFCSLGVSADYVASFIGRARFFLEITEHMPRTFGRNQLHVSQLEGWCQSDRGLVEVEPVVPTDIDTTIGHLVAERIPDGATIQTGIGAIPNAIMASLTDHRNLGIHTELISDGVVDLMESGVVNGVKKRLNRTKAVGTFALGTKRLHEFLHENTALELHAVRYVNDPRIISNRISCRSTPPSASTSSDSAHRRRSTAGTTRRRAARTTSPGARCTPKAARASWSSIRRRRRATAASCRPSRRAMP